MLREEQSAWWRPPFVCCCRNIRDTDVLASLGPDRLLDPSAEQGQPGESTEWVANEELEENQNTEDWEIMWISKENETGYSVIWQGGETCWRLHGEWSDFKAMSGSVCALRKSPLAAVSVPSGASILHTSHRSQRNIQEAGRELLVPLQCPFLHVRWGGRSTLRHMESSCGLQGTPWVSLWKPEPLRFSILHLEVPQGIYLPISS